MNLKKMLAVSVVAVLVLGLGGVALAQWGGPGSGPGFGPQGQMAGGGPGWGPGKVRGRGWGPCVQGRQQGAAAPAEAIDDAKAKEIASEFVQKNLAGYQVEKVVKFERPRGAMYRIEAKGPNGEIQYLTINPFGNVRAPRFTPGRAL